MHPPLTPDNIIFTENIGNLKLIDVGYEQRPRLSHQSVADDIYNYGLVLTEALDAAKSTDPVLRRVARRCSDADPKRRFTTSGRASATARKPPFVGAGIDYPYFPPPDGYLRWRLMSPLSPRATGTHSLAQRQHDHKCLYSFIPVTNRQRPTAPIRAKFGIDLYRGNDCHVPPLITDQIDTLRPRGQPAYDFCEAQSFMAFRNGEPVGAKPH